MLPTILIPPPLSAVGRDPPAAGAAVPLAAGLCKGVAALKFLPRPTRGGIEATVPPRPGAELAVAGAGACRGLTGSFPALETPTEFVAVEGVAGGAASH